MNAGFAFDPQMGQDAVGRGKPFGRKCACEICSAKRKAATSGASENCPNAIVPDDDLDDAGFASKVTNDLPVG
jgi:hypothetical protein